MPQCSVADALVGVLVDLPAEQRDGVADVAVGLEQRVIVCWPVVRHQELIELRWPILELPLLEIIANGGG